MFIVVGQETRRGSDVYLEDGSDWRLERCFGVKRAKGAEVVGSQQELGCILHGGHIQVAEIKHAEQKERHIRWDQVCYMGQRPIN